MIEGTKSIPCWNIVLQNGKPLCFCDAEQNINVEGYEYISDPAFFRSATEQNLGGTGNVEINGIISSSAIRYDDVKIGLYQNAPVEIFLYDPEKSQKLKTVFYGYISQVDFSDNKMSAELRDFSTSLHNKFGDIYSPQCRATFGSVKCGVHLADYKYEARVIKMLSPTKMRLNKSFENNHLKFGKVRVINERNAGATEFITSNMGYVVDLVKPFNLPLLKGVTVELTAGCDKTIATCAGKFCNALNFRGEPFVPNIDKIL